MTHQYVSIKTARGDFMHCSWPEWAVDLNAHNNNYSRWLVLFTSALKLIIF